MTRVRIIVLVACILSVPKAPVQGQSDPGNGPHLANASHMMDDAIHTRVSLDQFEARIGAGANAFRWQGQAWIGTDYDKLWLKSEGFALGRGRVDDGQHELLYDRAISTWFDLQAGLRTELDSGTGRTWAALGVQGVLPWFVNLEATAYASDGGHLAARFAVSYDLRVTERLILEPDIELNLYSKADPGRGVGAGLSSLDAGLRLRYEITRKFAPYIGVTYAGRFGQTARFTRKDGDGATAVQVVFGIKSWF